jgi:drug/metabolite transporter (DMT)-like permease
LPNLARNDIVQGLVPEPFGFLVFGDKPDLWTIAGGAIVIASGLYLLHRERAQGNSA